VSNVTNMETMLSNSGISTVNYDALLQGWSAQNLQSNLNLGAHDLNYCNAEAERQSLIDNFGWTIEGDAVDPNCSTSCEVEIIASATEICAGESVDLSVNSSSGAPGVNTESHSFSSGDYTTIPYSSSQHLYNLDQTTIEFWYYQESSSEEFIVCTEYFSTGWGFHVENNSQGPDRHLEWRVEGQKVGRDIPNRYEIPFNQWIHIAGVHDGQNLFLYVNGNLIQSLPYTGNIGTVTDDIVINRHRWASGVSSRLSGSIDELRISNIARYSSEFTPPNYEFINDDNTLVLFHFNGNIEDESSYAVQGTINGTSYSNNTPFDDFNSPSNESVFWSTGDTTETISVNPTETTEYWVDVTTNGVTCRDYITINVDTEDPTWLLPPSDLTVACDGTGNTTEFNNWLNNTFSGTDNCGSVTITTNSTGLSDDCGGTGSETVTFTLTDSNNNAITLDATFTIEDTTDPTMDIAASDTTIECDGTSDPFAAWLSNNGGASASDVCSGVTWTNDSTGLSDLCGATGTETVTFTATDECGNATSTTATFTIEDTTNPTMDVAASDLIIQCNDDNSAAIDAWLSTNGGASASDVCSGVTWTNDFTTLNDGVCGALTTVIFTATDECGNFTTTEANINTEDTIPPVIGCPGDVTAVTEDGDCGAIVNFQPAVATDNCGTAFVYQTGGLGSGSVFPVGDTLIEYTAQDECGNLATCTFTVTVIDDDAPVAICQDLTVILDDTGNATITAGQLNFGSNDNCGVESLAINVDTFDCSNVGANEVTLTVTDIHGNTATCVATVTVLDNTAPIAVCQDITLELGDDGSVTIDPLAVDGGSSDACGIASYELNTDTLDCSNLGNTAVILTVTDVNGNQSSCSAIVTLEDNSAPVLVCNDTTVELNEDGVAFIIPSLVADISDNCGTGAVTIDVQEVSCADIGTPVTVNVFANDGSGNTASCSAIVTVVDLLAPEIVCPDNQSVNLDPNGTHTLADYIGDGSATATDNCTDPVTIFSQDPVAGSVLGFGTQVITFTAEDQYGNVSTCSFELDIQEILGVGDVEDFASLVLYPNPADSKVNLSNPRQIDLNNVTIYDLTGRIVNKVDLSTMGSEITIDISTLANATYMLLIKGSQGISTKQLIVNNY